MRLDQFPTLVKGIMFHMKVPDNIKYITNLYDSLTGFVHSSSWVTSVFPITHGVFQGDTMSPIIFLMALTPVIKMMEKINCPGSISISQSPKAKTFHIVEQPFKCYGKKIIQRNLKAGTNQWCLNITQKEMLSYYIQMAHLNT